MKTLIKKVYAVVNLSCKDIDDRRKKRYNMLVIWYYIETILFEGNLDWYTIAVTLAVRSHLFSYRTQKLSSPSPKILCWRRHGKIGSCCIQKKNHSVEWFFLLDKCKQLPYLPYGKKSQLVCLVLYLLLCNYFYGVWLSFNATYPPVGGWMVVAVMVWII